MPIKPSLLVNLATILFLISGCASLPPLPTGNFCVVSVASNGAVCVPISVVATASGSPTSVFVPFVQMDNYITVSPTTWAAIQTYLGQLKIIAQRQCQ